ncbi:MAG: abortive infection family protein [Pseudomonadota bacterium]
MKISERTIKRLGEIITGDKKFSAYRSGPKLVTFFNELGFNDVYGQGFGSRWAYAEDKIRALNGSDDLRKCILAAFDPRDWMEATLYDDSSQEMVGIVPGPALTYLNDFLSFDGYEVVKHGLGYEVVDKSRGEILFDIRVEPSHLSHRFIVEQVEKCRAKIASGDFDGAITNARSLTEAVLLAVEETFDPKSAGRYDGNLPKLYGRVSKHLNLSEEESQIIDDNLKQIMRGFVNIIGGLSGISNNMGDRHARRYRPAKHHATLIANASMTLCNFIFDTYDYQVKK